MRQLDLTSLEDAVQVQVGLPVDLAVLVLDVNSLGNKNSLVDVWQTAREEGTELDEIFNANAFLFGLTSVSTLLRRSLWLEIRAWSLHLFLLVLIGHPFHFFLLRQLFHILVRHRAH